jgi:hypothetical protein
VINTDRAKTDDQYIDLIKNRIIVKRNVLVVIAALFEPDALQEIHALRPEKIADINIFGSEKFVKPPQYSHGMVRMYISAEVCHNRTPFTLSQIPQMFLQSRLCHTPSPFNSGQFGLKNDKELSRNQMCRLIRDSS